MPRELEVSATTTPQVFIEKRVSTFEICAWLNYRVNNIILEQLKLQLAIYGKHPTIVILKQIPPGLLGGTDISQSYSIYFKNLTRW